MAQSTGSDDSRNVRIHFNETVYRFCAIAWKYNQHHKWKMQWKNIAHVFSQEYSKTSLPFAFCWACTNFLIFWAIFSRTRASVTWSISEVLKTNRSSLYNYIIQLHQCTGSTASLVTLSLWIDIIIIYMNVHASHLHLHTVGTLRSRTSTFPITDLDVIRGQLYAQKTRTNQMPPIP